MVTKEEWLVNEYQQKLTEADELYEKKAYKKAKAIYQDLIKIDQVKENLSLFYDILEKIAQMDYHQRNFEKALSKFEKVLEYLETKQNGKEFQIGVLSRLVTVYCSLDSIELAEQCANKLEDLIQNSLETCGFVNLKWQIALKSLDTGELLKSGLKMLEVCDFSNSDKQLMLVLDVIARILHDLDDIEKINNAMATPALCLKYKEIALFDNYYDMISRSTLKLFQDQGEDVIQQFIDNYPDHPYRSLLLQTQDKIHLFNNNYSNAKELLNKSKKIAENYAHWNIVGSINSKLIHCLSQENDPNIESLILETNSLIEKIDNQFVIFDLIVAEYSHFKSKSNIKCLREIFEKLQRFSKKIDNTQLNEKYFYYELDFFRLTLDFNQGKPVAYRFLGDEFLSNENFLKLNYGINAIYVLMECGEYQIIPNFLDKCKNLICKIDSKDLRMELKHKITLLEANYYRNIGKYDESLSMLNLIHSDVNISDIDKLSAILSKMPILRQRNDSGTINHLIGELIHFAEDPNPFLNYQAAREVAIFFRDKDEYDKALDYNEIALKSSQKLHYSINYVLNLETKGSILSRFTKKVNSIDEGIDTLNLGLTEIQNHKIDHEVEGSINHNLGDLYCKKLNNTSKAFKYFDKAKSIAKKFDDKISVKRTELAICQLKIDIGNYQEALNELKMLEGFFLSNQMNFELIVCYSSIARTSFWLQDYEGAENYCLKSLEINAQNNRRDSYLNSLLTLLIIYVYQGLTKKVDDVKDKIDKLLDVNKFPIQSINLFYNYAEELMRRKMHREAYKLYEKAFQLLQETSDSTSVKL
ncbi:MAG: tetratricopeptide repeat protein [Candidatus Heimdallarchaeota archaeon]|nr:tetratricopeptide repeat protein [Candidatus Heimdallarchaeota archaeon]